MAIDRQSVFAVNLINIMSFEERTRNINIHCQSSDDNWFELKSSRMITKHNMEIMFGFTDDIKRARAVSSAD